MRDFLICGCRSRVCPLYARVALAVHQSDENGPGWRRLKEARSEWLDHILEHQRTLEQVAA
jgi:hypothetical protein